MTGGTWTGLRDRGGDRGVGSWETPCIFGSLTFYTPTRLGRPRPLFLYPTSGFLQSPLARPSFPRKWFVTNRVLHPLLRSLGVRYPRPPKEGSTDKGGDFWSLYTRPPKTSLTTRDWTKVNGTRRPKGNLLWENHDFQWRDYSRCQPRLDKDGGPQQSTVPSGDPWVSVYTVDSPPSTGAGTGTPGVRVDVGGASFGRPGSRRQTVEDGPVPPYPWDHRKPPPSSQSDLVTQCWVEFVPDVSGLLGFGPLSLVLRRRRGTVRRRDLNGPRERSPPNAPITTGLHSVCVRVQTT